LIFSCALPLMRAQIHMIICFFIYSTDIGIFFVIDYETFATIFLRLSQRFRCVCFYVFVVRRLRWRKRLFNDYSLFYNTESHRTNHKKLCKKERVNVCTWDWVREMKLTSKWTELHSHSARFGWLIRWKLEFAGE
jgi:hypothetical protein